MFKKLSFFIFLISIFNPFYHNAMAWDTCPMDGTKIDRSELINVTRPAGTFSYVCEAPVETFDITIRQLAMCTSDPTDYLNGNSSEDPCIYLLDYKAGDTPISVGITSAAETSFPATFPPTGTYTHGYGLLDKTIAITAEYEVNNTILAANENGNGWVPGITFFGPGNRTVTMENLANAQWQLSTEGFASSQSQKNTINFAYNSLSTSSFLNTLSSVHPTSGNVQKTYLLDSNSSLASTYNEVEDLLIVDTYASPKVITDATNEIIYKYSPALAGRIIWEKSGPLWIAYGFMLGNVQFAMDFN